MSGDAAGYAAEKGAAVVHADILVGSIVGSASTALIDLTEKLREQSHLSGWMRMLRV